MEVMEMLALSMDVDCLLELPTDTTKNKNVLQMHIYLHTELLGKICWRKGERGLEGPIAESEKHRKEQQQQQTAPLPLRVVRWERGGRAIQSLVDDAELMVPSQPCGVWSHKPYKNLKNMLK